MINELPLGGTVGAAEGLVLTGGSPGTREIEEEKRALTGVTSRLALKQAAFPALINDMVVTGIDSRWECTRMGCGGRGMRRGLVSQAEPNRV